MTKRRRPKERFEWALLAEQGRYAEAVRNIAERMREEFSSFPEPTQEALREKVETLDEALSALTDLNERMTLLRMIGEAIESYREAEEADERDRASTAILFVLDQVGRRVPDTPESKPQPGA